MPTGKGPLKIGMVAHSFYPAKDGVAIHVYNLARQLVVLGQDVHVFTSGGKNAVEQVKGFTVHRIRAWRMPIFSSLYICPGLLPALWKCSPDIVHAHGYGNFFSPVAGLYAMLAGKRLVLTLHGYPDLQGAKRAFLALYRAFLAPFFLMPAKRIISVSALGKEWILKETKKDIDIIPNGVDVSLFGCKTDYRKNGTVAYIGRLDEDKGVMRIASEISPERKVLFAGKDEGMRERLASECKRRGVDAEFTEVEPDRVPEIYCRSRLVILPSRYEGFPLTMLEALASGRPFLATDVGEIKAVLSELMPGSWEHLIVKGGIEDAIKDADAHEAEIAKDLAGIRGRIKKYGWAQVAERTLGIYGKAMERAPQPTSASPYSPPLKRNINARTIITTTPRRTNSSVLSLLPLSAFVPPVALEPLWLTEGEPAI